MNFLYFVTIAKFLALFTILYYLLGLLLISKMLTPCFIHRKNYNVFNSIFPIVLIFLILSFCDGDNFHYIKWFYYANHNGKIDESSVQEPIYQLLSFYINGDYFIFRILVWGLAIFLFSLTAKRLFIPPRVALICLYCLFLFIFSYARASLGMSIYFYGLTFLIKPIYKSKLFSYFLGLILIITSILFHNSMIVLLVLTFPILLIPNYSNSKKYLFFIYIFLLILFLYFSILIIEDFIESSDIPHISGKVKSYTNIENSSKGIFDFIIESSLTLLMLYSLFLTRKSLISNNYCFPMSKLFIFSITLLSIAITLSLMGPGYSIISYRIKYMSIIPISLVVAYSVYRNYLSYKKFKILLLFGISIIIFKMLFYYYLTTKGLGIDLYQTY